jgi:hypothetical protein
MNIFSIVILLIATCLEGTVTTIPLTVTVVTTLAITIGWWSLPWIFLSGILLDLFQLRSIGATPLFFLAAYWLADRYGEKFYTRSALYTSIYLIVVSALYNFLFYRTVDWVRIILALVVGLILLFILRSREPIHFKGREKLGV